MAGARAVAVAVNAEIAAVAAVVAAVVPVVVVVVVVKKSKHQSSTFKNVQELGKPHTDNGHQSRTSGLGFGVARLCVRHSKVLVAAVVQGPLPSHGSIKHSRRAWCMREGKPSAAKAAV